MFTMEAELTNMAHFAVLQHLGRGSLAGGAAARSAMGRFSDSSFDLQRGLEVIEHHGLPDGDCEVLLELVRFE